jgi:hypothetical protein
MKTRMRALPEQSEPFPEDEIETYHSPEPWRQDGRYIRDAAGAIVVRGRTVADARRIVAAINATRDIPTDALELWHVQDVSNPRTRPDLEVVVVPEPEPSPFVVRPPVEAIVPVLLASTVPEPPGPPPAAMMPDRRRGERRRGDRRVSSAAPEDLPFERRVMERRIGDRRRRPAGL